MPRSKRTFLHAAAAAIAVAAFGVPAARASVPITPTVAVTPSSTHPTTGSDVTYSVTLAPAPPAGTVAIWDNGSPVADCQTLALSSGTTVCTTKASTDAGLHFVSVMYSGYGSYAPASVISYSSVFAKTATVVTASPKLADPGETMLYKALITPRPIRGGITSVCSGGCGGVPTETVDFAVDGAAVADCQKRAVDGETGVALCKTATAPADGGRHVVTASYSASDDAYLTASTGTDDFTVKTPGIALSATALDFGSVKVGETGTRTVTITNPGTRALTLGAITAGGAYSVTGSDCHPTVDAAGGCELTVSFKPTAAGAAAASLTVASDAGAPEVALAGVGVAATAPTGASLPPNSKARFTVTTPTDGGSPIKLKLSPAFIRAAHKRGIRLVHATLTVNTTFTDGSKASRQEKVVIRIPKPAVKKKAAAKQAPRFTG